MDAEGKRLTSVGQTAAGDAITIRIADGKIQAQVTETVPYQETRDHGPKSHG